MISKKDLLERIQKLDESVAFLKGELKKTREEVEHVREKVGIEDIPLWESSLYGFHFHFPVERKGIYGDLDAIEEKQRLLAKAVGLRYEEESPNHPCFTKIKKSKKKK